MTKQETKDELDSLRNALVLVSDQLSLNRHLMSIHDCIEWSFVPDPHFPTKQGHLVLDFGPFMHLKVAAELEGDDQMLQWRSLGGGAKLMEACVRLMFADIADMPRVVQTKGVTNVP